MAVALDSNGAGGAGGVTGAVSTQTVSATIASGSVLVVSVFVSSGAVTVSNVKWNTSETLTLIDSNSTAGFVGMYGLANPTSGTHNIVVTFSGNLGSQVAQTGWVSATGAATASPFVGTNSDNRGLSVTTSVAGSMVTDCMRSSGAALSPSGTTIMLNRDSVLVSQDWVTGYQLVASPSSVNASWAVASGPDTGHSHVAVTIAPPSVAGSTPVPTLLLMNVG